MLSKTFSSLEKYCFDIQLIGIKFEDFKSLNYKLINQKFTEVRRFPVEKLPISV